MNECDCPQWWWPTNEHECPPQDHTNGMSAHRQTWAPMNEGKHPQTWMKMTAHEHKQRWPPMNKGSCLQMKMTPMNEGGHLVLESLVQSSFLAQKTRLRLRLVQMFPKTKKKDQTRSEKDWDCSLFWSWDQSWSKLGFSQFRPVFQPIKQ